MITFVEGNLFDSPAQVLTNTVNTVGVMGKGIALNFKNSYPEMFLDYKNRCKQGLVRIGEPYLWENDEVQILNFPTKENWRNNSKLEYVEKGLQYLRDNYQAMGICTLALAPLGCGNGGLYWPDVKALMIKYLGPLPGLEVFAYLPRMKNVQSSIDHKEERNDMQKPINRYAGAALEQV
jgi:O-acetyl-ADP-ribose deacetylase (regulator of RNase III)